MHGFVVPARADRWPNFGLLALYVALAGLFTGAFLALHYAPTLEAARASVAHVEGQVALGGFLRGLHHWAGTFALLLAAVHGGRLFWHGAYKRPRRLLWVLGCGIFLVLLGFAYTGYLLPGDERAYAGMGVLQGVAGATPGVGDELGAIVQGGGAISSAMLTRLYAVHAVILPAALLLLSAAFVLAWRRRGPARHHADASEDVVPAWPRALRRDAAAAVAVTLLLALAAWALPPALGPAPDLEGGAPMDAQPEWFFLWVNELLHRVEGFTFVIAGVLPGLLVGLALGLPLLARGSERAPARRRPELAAAAGILVALGVLTALALGRPEAEGGGGDGPPAPPAGADLEERAQAALEKFKCSKCHAIDGQESEQETGPPLARAARDGKPPFRDLYTREFFRLKVGDPRAFWPDTAMVYTPKRLKPTPDELDALERWFFDD